MEKGENDFYVELDKPIGSKENGDVIEEAEYDNDARITDVSPTFFKTSIHLMPDLFIEEIDWDPTVPEKDEAVEFTITIGNNGTADYESTDNAKVTLKAGTTWISSSSGQKISNRIIAGQSDEITFNWDDGPDEEDETYKIKVYIDFDDDLDKDNNRLDAELKSDPGGDDGGVAGLDPIVLAGGGGIVGLILVLLIFMSLKHKKEAAKHKAELDKLKAEAKGAGPKKGKVPPGKKGKVPPGKKPPAPPGKKGKMPPGKRPPAPGGKEPPGKRPPAPPGAKAPPGKPPAPGAKPPAPGGRKSIPCPKCKTAVPITSDKRPLPIKCPKCGHTGKLNK
jgi:uncharacterized repeat protein (TIGR01451 family)